MFVMKLPLRSAEVALRKESVDRNGKSPRPCSASCRVALRKESMDRNQRRVSHRGIFADVALRKESVDRNDCAVVAFQDPAGRSPQGERG